MACAISNCSSLSNHYVLSMCHIASLCLTITPLHHTFLTIPFLHQIITSLHKLSHLSLKSSHLSLKQSHTSPSSNHPYPSSNHPSPSSNHPSPSSNHTSPSNHPPPSNDHPLPQAITPLPQMITLSLKQSHLSIKSTHVFLRDSVSALVNFSPNNIIRHSYNHSNTNTNTSGISTVLSWSNNMLCSPTVLAEESNQTNEMCKQAAFPGPPKGNQPNSSTASLQQQNSKLHSTARRPPEARNPLTLWGFPMKGLSAQRCLMTSRMRCFCPL